MKLKYDEESKARNMYLQRLITKSIEIKNKIVTIDEKRQLSSKKPSGASSSSSHTAHFSELLSELELSVSRLATGDLKDDGL
jgi:hypothetical protein